MKIKSVYCKAFKRFTELSIRQIPPEAKLVCLVGPNGVGKSSLFDVFNYCIQPTKHRGGSFSIDPEYHIKVIGDALVDSGNYQQTWGSGFENVAIEFHDSAPIKAGATQFKKETFYIRSGYRHEADVNVDNFQRVSDMLNDANRPQTLISLDKRVTDNYQRIVADSVESIFSDRLPDNSTKAAIRDRLIGEARESLGRLFPNLTFEGVGNPLERGTFYFTKGNAKNWKYKNLSAGEKAAFDLMLDFVIKTEAFSDTVFCIDEPESHMHSDLQARLLDELYRNIPSSSQLWIATHSIGMMRKAKQLNESFPGAVIFLDFDNRDFDQTVNMQPATVDRPFWKKTFAVAIGDLADLVAPSKIVFCEGSQSLITGPRTGEFDSRCFRRIFTAEFPDVEFVSLGSANDVEKNSILLTTIFRQVLSGVVVTGVVDRDDRNLSEVQDLGNQGIRVLSKRHIECFLFDDEILTKLCHVCNLDEKISDVLNAKQAALKASVERGKPADDYKSMSSQLCADLKKILRLTQCGNTKEAFCVDAIAPLITPETAVYQQLKHDVL